MFDSVPTTTVFVRKPFLIFDCHIQQSLYQFTVYQASEFGVTSLGHYKVLLPWEHQTNKKKTQPQWPTAQPQSPMRVLQVASEGAGGPCKYIQSQIGI